MQSVKQTVLNKRPGDRSAYDNIKRLVEDGVIGQVYHVIVGLDHVTNIRLSIEVEIYDIREALWQSTK